MHHYQSYHNGWCCSFSEPDRQHIDRAWISIVECVCVIPSGPLMCVLVNIYVCVCDLADIEKAGFMSVRERSCLWPWPVFHLYYCSSINVSMNEYSYHLDVQVYVRWNGCQCNRSLQLKTCSLQPQKILMTQLGIIFVDYSYNQI